MKQSRCGLAELLRRLQENPRGTLHYPGDPTDRDTSLAATLDLSFEILPDEAQRVLPLLALFPAGLTRHAAEHILGAAAIPALETLLQHSMAEYRHEEQRFALPEPARRYAEGLQAEGTLEQYAPKALAYVASLISFADDLIADKGQIVEGRNLLTLEQPNLMRFLDWGYANEPGDTRDEHGPVCQSARATAALGNYWTITDASVRAETLERAQRALDAALRLGDRLGEANTRKAMGDVQQFRDDRDAALTSYQQALALFQAVGSKLGEANTLAAQSRLLIDDDPAQSQTLLEQALHLRRSINSVFDEAADNYNYGLALLQRGRNDEALPYLQRARDLFASRELEDFVAQTDHLIAQAGGETPQPPSFDAILQQFEPLLQAIAAVAQGDETDRAEIEAVLPQYEEKGWHIADATRRIWNGERNAAALSMNLDETDAALVRRMLALLGL
jgi:tetratricopeptide (TPR) repeat protein